MGALIFDILYKNTAEMLWAQAASSLVVLGLIIAIIPRLINLFYVWFRPIKSRRIIEIKGFFLYGFGIVSAIFNAFVHSRDAYAMVPANVTLSVITVITVILISLHYLLQSKNSNNLED